MMAVDHAPNPAGLAGDVRVMRALLHAGVDEGIAIERIGTRCRDHDAGRRGHCGDGSHVRTLGDDDLRQCRRSSVGREFLLQRRKLVRVTPGDRPAQLPARAALGQVGGGTPTDEAGGAVEHQIEPARGHADDFTAARTRAACKIPRIEAEGTPGALQMAAACFQPFPPRWQSVQRHVMPPSTGSSAWRCVRPRGYAGVRRTARPETGFIAFGSTGMTSRQADVASRAMWRPVRFIVSQSECIGSREASTAAVISRM